MRSFVTFVISTEGCTNKNILHILSLQAVCNGLQKKEIKMKLRNSSGEEVFWQKYTNEKLTEEDIFEINQNLQNFARVLLKIRTELKNKKEKRND